MIISTVGFCDLYKVGLLSGKKYNWRELRGFMLACTSLESKFYFKDSFISQADLDRTNLPQSCVGRDYDMFNTIQKGVFMKCKKCGEENGDLKKTCTRCGSFLEGYAINNVTGKLGYRGSDGFFYESEAKFNDKQKNRGLLKNE